MNIQPVRKTSLSEYVVYQLKEMIIKREIKIGDRLPNERELSKLFEVSRTSVREALRVLELQGLLNRGNSGTYVQANFSKIIEESLTLQILLNDASYKDIQQTRIMLERELIRLATFRRSKDHLQNIKENIKKMERAVREKNNDLYIEADISFHNEIAVAANNSVLLFLYNSISELISKIQKSVSFDDEGVNTSLKYHKSIYQALEDQNLSQAEDQLVNHLIDVDNRLHKK
ncbi:FadR/GntR family transcriptional regulator [Virgibacillus sediminis]|uniref:FadR/GntR family transcriptional regulator n=1 Tax=Virgibacillus sediminis TaxID=202260 RepID=A0ABV7A3Z5_9BACI